MKIIENATVLENVDDISSIISFVNDRDDPSDFFMIQKAHQYDGQDRVSSIDRMHLEFGDQSKSCYGGLEKVVFDTNLVEMHISDEAASKLDIGPRIRISLKPNENSCAALRSLRKMLVEDGVPVFDATE